MSGTPEAAASAPKISIYWLGLLRVFAAASVLSFFLVLFAFGFALVLPSVKDLLAAASLSGYYATLLWGIRGTPRRSTVQFARNFASFAFFGLVQLSLSELADFFPMAILALTQFAVVVSAGGTLSSMERAAGQKTRRTWVFGWPALLVVALYLYLALVGADIMRSQEAANEASAAWSLRAVGTANMKYSAAYHQGFAGSLAQLGFTTATCATVSSECAGLRDSKTVPFRVTRAGTLIKSGYIFTYSAPNASPSPERSNATFSLIATPVNPGSTGYSAFCVDQSNVILRDLTGMAKAATSPQSGCAGFAGDRLVRGVGGWASMTSEMVSNEDRAALSLGAVGTANMKYSAAYHQGFAGSLAQLGFTTATCATVSSECAGLRDSETVPLVTQAGTPNKSGYIFTYSTPNASPSPERPNATFPLIATPENSGITGYSTFCVDQSNVVRIDVTGMANSTTSPQSGCAGFAGQPM